MGILGIKNRTENWKTAKTFEPFFGNESLKRKLVSRLDPSDTDPEYVRLELFRKGVRDYIDGENRPRPKAERKSLKDFRDDFAAAFKRHFGDLRTEVNEYIALDPRALNPLKDGNYTLVGKTKDGSSARDKLASNLNGIEIDIVLETPKHLLIGEAKDESKFGTDGSQVLVHQLVGQYVQATILLDVLKIEKQVTPFIVGQDKAAVMKSGQVQFMLWKKWLHPDNILTWHEVKGIAAD